MLTTVKIQKSYHRFPYIPKAPLIMTVDLTIIILRLQWLL